MIYVFVCCPAHETGSNALVEAGRTSFGTGDFQKFISTGLLGALITTIVGSLWWRIIASSYPLAYMSNPLILLITQICLALESTGICQASVFLGKIHRRFLREDKEYLDEADAIIESRAADIGNTL